MIDWPERTGLSSRSEPGCWIGGEAGGFSASKQRSSSGSLIGRPLRKSGGSCGAERRRARALQARDPDVALGELHHEMGDLRAVQRRRGQVEDDGRPMKKSGERSSHASSFSSQSATGSSGVNKKAM